MAVKALRCRSKKILVLFLVKVFFALLRVSQQGVGKLIKCLLESLELFPANVEGN